jgi:predicted DCC family thiol-disulfide oxidoreductase YuxK
LSERAATAPPSRAPYSYRHDPAVPQFLDDRPIIIFDGYCALCSGWADFVLRHDRRRRFRLLPAQSPLGHALYVHYGLDPTNYETHVLIAGGVAYFKSDAALRMAAGLGFPWSAAEALRILPARLRDAFYDRVAGNRFRLYGRRDTCYVPTSEDRDRFLS